MLITDAATKKVFKTQAEKVRKDSVEEMKSQQILPREKRTEDLEELKTRVEMSTQLSKETKKEYDDDHLKYCTLLTAITNDKKAVQALKDRLS